MKKFLFLLSFTVILSVLFSGCEKKGDPPVLPSVETMKIDFSNFTPDSKSGFATENLKGVENYLLNPSGMEQY